MKLDDLIAFIIEEAQHRVISDERSKNAESALADMLKGPVKEKLAKRSKTKQILMKCARTVGELDMESLTVGQKEEAKRDKARDKRKSLRKKKPNQLL
jgi:hypothetical protein